MKYQIITQYSPFFILLAIAIALIYAFAFYYREKKFKDLKKWMLWSFAALRFLTVFIIILLLLSPMIKTFSTTVQKPSIVIAVDNSQSIKMVEKTSIDSLKISVKKLINKLSKKYPLKTLSFDSKITDSLLFDFKGNYTDISNLLSRINDDYYNRNLGAVILFTDGIYTKGENPLFIAQESIAPIYSVLLGDTVTHKDLLIKDLTYNKVVFLGNDFPLIISVYAKKMKNTDAVIEVFHKGKKITQKKVYINSNEYLKKINFTIPADEKGTQRYTVRISHIEGEKNLQNNVKHFAVEVIDKRKKILILYNSPHPDIGALKRALETQKTYKIQVEKAEDFNGKISDYNLIIFHSLPSMSNNISSIWQSIISNKIPYIFIFSSQTNYYKFNSLNASISVVWNNKLFDNAQGMSNDDFTIFKLEKDFKNLLPKLPPLIVPYGSINFPVDAQVPIYQRINGLPTSKPLVVLIPQTQSNNVKSAYILGENIWRWRMFCYKYNKNFKAFDNFINQLVNYTALNLNKQRFIVSVKHIIAENSEVIFKAQLYNEVFQLINTPEVNLTITDSTGKNYKYIFDKTGDSYQLNIGVLLQGKYQYTAKVKYGGKQYIQKGEIVVIPINVEAEDLQARFQLLAKLSASTGGKLFYINQLDSLPYYIMQNENIKPLSYTTEDITSFIKFKLLFFVLLLLLGLEWFLRKFFGYY